jgi:hypothetical protein
MDKDNPFDPFDPFGAGDTELIDCFTPSEYWTPCPDNYYVQAQKIGDPTTIYNSAEEIKRNLNQTVHFVVNRYALFGWGVGLSCINAENLPAGCFDYQVRFCCGESNKLE